MRDRRTVREVAVSVSFCVPHGFIPFCRPFIHTPSLAHSVIVMLALSHSFHPFSFSAPRLFTLVLFVSVPPSRAHHSSPSSHLRSTLLTLCFLFLHYVPLLYLFSIPLAFLLPASALISQILYLSLEMSDIRWS